MSYAANLAKPSQPVNHFIHVGYRVEIDETWTNVSGNVYSVDWADRPIGKVTVLSSGSPIRPSFALAATYEDIFDTPTEMESKSVFFDPVTQKLYVNFTNIESLSIDPNSGTIRIFAEKLYFISTVDAGLNIIPTDDSSPQVLYRGVIRTVPDIQISVSESAYGFFPTYVNSVIVSNDGGYLNELFGSGSLNNCIFKIYRCVGEIYPENCKLVFIGNTKDASFSDNSVTINYSDLSYLLDKSIEQTRFVSPFDPDYVDTLNIGFLCGKHKWVRAVCTDYNDEEGGNVNRSWYFGERFGVAYGAPDILRYDTNNSAVGSNTTTRTYLDSVAGLAVGMLFTVNATSTFRRITAVNTGSSYIDHSTLSGALGASDYIRKFLVSEIAFVRKDGGSDTHVDASDFPFRVSQRATTTVWNLANGGDFFDSGSVERDGDYGIEFANNIESDRDDNTKVALDPFVLFGNRFIGPDSFYILGGVLATCGSFLFPGQSAPLGGYQADGMSKNPVQAIYEILYCSGFWNNAEYYDSASFTALATAIASSSTPAVAVATLDKIGDPTSLTFRELISRICSTFLLKLYMKNGKWFITRVGPLGSATITPDSYNTEDSSGFRLDSEEVCSKVVVKTDYSAASVKYEVTDDSWSYFTDTNNFANILNNRDRSNEITVYRDRINSTGATFAEKFLRLFMLPNGIVNLTLSLEFMDIGLGDVVLIDTANFEEGTFPFSGQKKFAVISIIERETVVDVTLSDQAGIEEDTGEWPS